MTSLDVLRNFSFRLHGCYMREQARGSFLVSTSSHLETTTFSCGNRRTFIPVLSYSSWNFADLGFGEEWSLPSNGIVSKCFTIAIYVKRIILEVFLHVAPKVFHFLVGVRKTLRTSMQFLSKPFKRLIFEMPTCLPTR